MKRIADATYIAYSDKVFAKLRQLIAFIFQPNKISCNVAKCPTSGSEVSHAYN